MQFYTNLHIRKLLKYNLKMFLREKQTKKQKHRGGRLLIINCGIQRFIHFQLRFISLVWTLSSIKPAGFTWLFHIGFWAELSCL